MKPKKALLGLGMLLAAAPVLGCRSNHLVFTTYTKVGLDISTTDAKPTSAMLGYKRFEGTIIPVDVDETGTVDAHGHKIPADARSVYAAIDLENSWVSGLKLYQVFATGAAAENASERPQAMKAVIDNLRSDKNAGGGS